MLWTWFRDWRERRSALRELKAKQRDEEDRLLDQDLNPLNLAKLSLSSGDLVKAAALWERARELLPQTILKSPDSLEILLGLGRLDEAEALMLQGRKRSPSASHYAVGLAIIAERRNDLKEALKRWEAAVEVSRDYPDAYVGAAGCLLALDRLDEAEVQYDNAIRRDPSKLHGWLGRARISDIRQNWPESLKRWKLMADRFAYEPGFAGYARVLGELGRLDEAEAALEQPALLFPQNLEIAATRAHLARRRGDLSTLCERWAQVRAIAPYFQPGYHEGALSLLEAGRDAEAEAILRTGIDRFPHEAWPLMEFARLAQQRQDWNEAAERWETVRQRFPAKEPDYLAGLQVLHAAMSKSAGFKDRPV